MKYAVRTISLALLLCLALSAITGCTSAGVSSVAGFGQRVAGMLDPSSRASDDPSERSFTTPGTFTVVVVDLSGSTFAATTRAMYLSVIGTLADRLGPGDRMIVMDVDRSSFQNSKYLADVEIPPFSFEASVPPANDNLISMRNFRSAERARYQRELAAYERRIESTVTKARARLVPSVRSAIMSTKTSGSDVPGALQMAGSLLSVARPGARLDVVVLTDAELEGERGIDWRRHTPTSADVDKAVTKHRAEGRLADLHGARVLLIGARGADQRHVAALGLAWQRYIASANGHLEPRYFMGAPARPLIDAWTGPAWSTHTQGAPTGDLTTAGR